MTDSGILLEQSEAGLYLYFPELMQIRGLILVQAAEGTDIPADLEIGDTVVVRHNGQQTRSLPAQLMASSLEKATGGGIIKPFIRIPLADGVLIGNTLEHARLLDVREKVETAAGVIPGAEMVPLTVLDDAKLEELAASDELLLIYCRSGNRSGQAQMALKNAGAKLVLNIGGIIEYNGETEIPQN